MKKIIKKYGNTLVVTFNREEQEIYELDIGDIVDIEMVNMGQEVDKDGD